MIENKMRNVIEKYRDVILYLFFGVCTTAVNVLVYWLVAYCLNGGTTISTILAWFMAVLFAYFTNRKWVFHSVAVQTKEILKEAVAFFSCRLTTGIVDVGCMFVFVQILGMNDMLIKLGSNILVIILNYIASKLLIFRKVK